MAAKGLLHSTVASTPCSFPLSHLSLLPCHFRIVASELWIKRIKETIFFLYSVENFLISGRRCPHCLKTNLILKAFHSFNVSQVSSFPGICTIVSHNLEDQIYNSSSLVSHYLEDQIYISYSLVSHKVEDQIYSSSSLVSHYLEDQIYSSSSLGCHKLEDQIYSSSSLVKSLSRG